MAFGQQGKAIFLMRMICRNRVVDFARWRRVFASHADAHRAAGLVLEHFWCDVNDPNNVFFVFEVRDVEKARAFIQAPDAADAAAASGVLEGEYHLVNEVAGY